LQNFQQRGTTIVGIWSEPFFDGIQRLGEQFVHILESAALDMPVDALLNLWFMDFELHFFGPHSQRIANPTGKPRLGQAGEGM
jgi:hypothetical protein